MGRAHRDQDSETRDRPRHAEAPPRAAVGSTPVHLPPRVARQRYRPAQPGIPDDPRVRRQMQRIARRLVRRMNAVPPLALDELKQLAARVVDEAGEAARAENCRDYATILVSNETWRDAVAGIPFDRRLLLLPKCLRDKDRCIAPIDAYGLECQGCGSCSINDLEREAERLGYVVMVAEGSTMVAELIESARVEAIIGVSCMNVLEKCFEQMESRAVPGLAVPLLQDGCAQTTVDLEWVRDAIHLTSSDRTYRLDLEALRRDVHEWFDPDALQRWMGPAGGESEEIAREWLARAGKRWRPYLTVCAAMAVAGDASGRTLDIPDDLKKLAIAVECFHKASLIHDDIEDGDELRYGEKTLHASHGIPVALNVGDLLLGEGYRLIGEVEAMRPAHAVRDAMLQVAANGHRMLCRGQGAELCWSRSPAPLTSLEVLDIFRHKTAPAFEVALRIGATFAGADPSVHEILRRYSEALGIAYQIRDDLEDHTVQGDSCDLRDRRPSLILSIAHRRAEPGPEKDLIASLWARRARFEEVADQLLRIINERGVIDKAGELLDAYLRQASESLSPLANATLKGLLRRVIGKIFGQDQIRGYCSEYEARNAAGGETSVEPAA